MISANQPFRYYDIWALRAPGWSENDCWEEFRKLTQTMGRKRALKIAVTSRMHSIPVNSSPIEVDSAFGGLAIYRIEAFLRGNYLGENLLGEEICEHVPFHKELRRYGYKLFINPKMVNLKPNRQRMTMVKETVVKFFKHFGKYR